LTDRAVAWVERAAGRAAHRTFHVVAEGLYSEGLSLLDGSPSSCRLKFLTERARARAAMRELDAARLDIDAAIEGARGAGADGAEHLARALLVLADIEQKEERWGAAE